MLHALGAAELPGIAREVCDITRVEPAIPSPALSAQPLTPASASVSAAVALNATAMAAKKQVGKYDPVWESRIDGVGRLNLMSTQVRDRPDVR